MLDLFYAFHNGLLHSHSLLHLSLHRHRLPSFVLRYPRRAHFRQQAQRALQRLSPAFRLTPDARIFFSSYYSTFHHKQLTDEEIIALVESVHDKALKTWPYRCVQEYRFSYPRVRLHPQYASLVLNNPQVSSLRVLEVGSCMGSDVRQMLLDGVKADNVLGLELEQGFIDLGLDALFCDRPTLGSAFAACNILESQPALLPALQTFLSVGPPSLAYCGSVYHLLGEQDTHTLTRHVYQLLAPGGVFIGRTVGSASGQPVDVERGDQLRFLHTRESFTVMCLQYGFVDVQFVSTEESDLSDVEHGRMRRAGTGMMAFSAKKAAGG